MTVVRDPDSDPISTSTSLNRTQLRNTQFCSCQLEIQRLNGLNHNHNMSDEEGHQDFRNQDSDGLEQEVEQDEDMNVDVGSSSKHKSSREVEGDPEEVEQEEGDDEDDEDDEEDDEEEESPGRKERKRAKVYPIFFLTRYVELHFIVIIAPP